MWKNTPMRFRRTIVTRMQLNLVSYAIKILYFKLFDNLCPITSLLTYFLSTNLESATFYIEPACVIKNNQNLLSRFYSNFTEAILLTIIVQNLNNQ